jgi:hypothetical protein
MISIRRKFGATSPRPAACGKRSSRIMIDPCARKWVGNVAPPGGVPEAIERDHDRSMCAERSSEEIRRRFWGDVAPPGGAPECVQGRIMTDPILRKWAE